jgi:hypothetical protein
MSAHEALDFKEKVSMTALVNDLACDAIFLIGPYASFH